GRLPTTFDRRDDVSNVFDEPIPAVSVGDARAEAWPDRCQDTSSCAQRIALRTGYTRLNIHSICCVSARGAAITSHTRPVLMNIYIDESGIFSNPANQANYASCVAALAIPSSQRSDITKGFRRIKSSWKLGSGEIKGSKLGEAQISEVIQLLKRYEVIFDLVVMDLGLLSDAEITDF